MGTSNDYETISQQIPSLSDLSKSNYNSYLDSQSIVDDLKTMQINPILSQTITNSTDDQKSHRYYSVENEYDTLDD